MLQPEVIWQVTIGVVALERLHFFFLFEKKTKGPESFDGWNSPYAYSIHVYRVKL